MKTKVIFLAIVAVLGGVGLKAYRETLALKSIDSYDSCVAARGSRIQESYPATCVTRLGDRFVQPLTDEEKQRLTPPSDTAREFTN
jgi:hypothetical protein